MITTLLFGKTSQTVTATIQDKQTLRVAAPNHGQILTNWHVKARSKKLVIIQTEFQSISFYEQRYPYIAMYNTSTAYYRAQKDQQLLIKSHLCLVREATGPDSGGPALDEDSSWHIDDMYLCVCIYIYACMYLFIYTHIYSCIFLCITCMYVCVCIYTVYIYIHAIYQLLLRVCLGLSLSRFRPLTRTDKSWRSSYNTNIYMHQYLISRWLQ